MATPNIGNPSTTLQQNLGFTDADLKVNRDGKMSPAQQKKLVQNRTQTLRIGVVIFIVLSLLASIVLYLATINESFILSIIGGVLVICNAAMVGLFGRQYMRISADMRSKELVSVSGKLERILRPQGMGNNYVLKIGAERFIVKKDIFRSFQHQEQYTLYSTKNTRMLLSAELKSNPPTTS